MCCPLPFLKAGDPELLGQLEKEKAREQGGDEKEQVPGPQQGAQPRLVAASVHSECHLMLPGRL